MSLPRKVRNYVEVKNSLEARYESLISNAVQWSSDLVNVPVALSLLREMDMIAYQFAAIRAYLEVSKARLLVYDSQFIDEIELYRTTLEKDIPVGELIAAVPALAVIRREYRENAREGGKMAHQVAVFPMGAFSSIISDALSALVPGTSQSVGPAQHKKRPLERGPEVAPNPPISAPSPPTSTAASQSSLGHPLAPTPQRFILSPQFPDGVLDFLEPLRKKIRLKPLGFSQWTWDNVRFLHHNWSRGYAYVADKVQDMYGVKLSKNALVYLGAHYGFDKHRIPAETFRKLVAREAVDLVDFKQLVDNLRRRIGGSGPLMNSPVLGFGIRFHSMLIGFYGTSEELQSHFSFPPIDPTVPPEESARTPPPVAIGTTDLPLSSQHHLQRDPESVPAGTRLPSLSSKTRVADLTTFEPVFGGPRASLMSHNSGPSAIIGRPSHMNRDGHMNLVPSGGALIQNRVQNIEIPNSSQRAPTTQRAQTTAEHNVSQPSATPKTPVTGAFLTSSSTQMPPIRTSPPRHPTSGYTSLNKPRPGVKPKVPSLEFLDTSDESTSNGSTPPPEVWSQELLQHLRDAAEKVHADDPQRVRSIQILINQATGLKFTYEQLQTKLREERLFSGAINPSQGANRPIPQAQNLDPARTPQSGTSNVSRVPRHQHLNTTMPMGSSSLREDAGQANAHFAMAYSRQNSGQPTTAQTPVVGSAIGHKTAPSATEGLNAVKPSNTDSNGSLAKQSPGKPLKSSPGTAPLARTPARPQTSELQFEATPTYSSTDILFASDAFYKQKFAVLDNRKWSLNMNRLVYISMEYLANPNPLMNYSTVKRTALGVIQVRLEKELRVNVSIPDIKKRCVEMLNMGMFGLGASRLVRDCCG